MRRCCPDNRGTVSDRARDLWRHLRGLDGSGSGGSRGRRRSTRRTIGRPCPCRRRRRRRRRQSSRSSRGRSRGVGGSGSRFLDTFCCFFLPLSTPLGDKQHLLLPLASSPLLLRRELLHRRVKALRRPRHARPRGPLGFEPGALGDRGLRPGQPLLDDREVGDVHRSGEAAEHLGKEEALVRFGVAG